MMLLDLVVVIKMDVTTTNQCFYCLFCSSSTLDVLKHSFESHSNQVNFRVVCSINGCQHTFCSGSSFSSYKTHASRKHPQWQENMNSCKIIYGGPALEPNLSSTAASGDMLSNQSIDGRMSDMSHRDESRPRDDRSVVKHHSTDKAVAQVLLTLQERYKTPQVAVDFVVKSMNDIVSQVSISLQESVIQGLEATESYSAYSNIEHCFNLRSPLASLQTEHQRTKYYKDIFSLVQPITIELGTSGYKYQGSGVKRRLVEQKDEFQYVPLIENLQSVLQNRNIYHEVFETAIESNSTYMTDFCDGQFFKDHLLFGSDKQALQIILYWDDVEVANPLGSYRGVHKLSLFYYFLGNIHPKLRSVLKSTFLLACVTSKNVQKYGLQPILKPFINEMNMLTKGVTMTILGQTRVVRGGLLYCLADTLAAHHIGGFKIGVGFSLRKCRMCLATKDQISVNFRAKSFVARTPESYNYHCLLLDGPLSKEDSITYGINFSSPLNLIDNFHVVDQLPQDIMHILLEGVVPYEMTHLLLSYIMEDKLFSIELLNDRIAEFPYSSDEKKDKPTQIKWHTLSSNTGKNMNQSSSQMWLLASYLPLMIGDLIPENDKKWECFLLLLDILQICTAKVLNSAHAGILEALVDRHHTLFSQCYPHLTITPKMHYLVHFPQQLIRIGPFINVWCMRMEAKNSYCKKIAQSSNFKNVPFTVANRHQRLLCSYLNDPDGFFDTKVKCGPLKSFKQTEDRIVYEEIKQFLTAYSLLSKEITLSSSKWIIFMGVKYSIKDFVILEWEENDLPIFGRITKILTTQDHTFLQFRKYKTIGIDRHYHCFVIKETNNNVVQLVHDIPHHEVYQGHQHFNSFRCGELKDEEDEIDVTASARQLAKKLEALIVEFKEVHYSVLDVLESEDELAREQSTFEEVDDEVTQLQIDIETLLSKRAASPVSLLVSGPAKDKKFISRKILYIKKKLDLIAATVNTVKVLDAHTLLEYATELSKYKKDLSDAHEELISQGIDEKEEVCEVHSSLEQFLFELSLKINSRRERVSSSHSEVAGSTKLHEGVKLPKLEVPKFSGDILQWRVFWEQFNISVHCRSNLTKSEKLVYLQQSLNEGSARSIVEGLAKTGDCYDEAIECIKVRYDRPRLLHQAHVKKIMDTPTLKSGTGKELRHLHDTVQQHLRALKAMGQEPSGAFITSMLELKLDPSTMFEWQRYSQKESDVPHYREFLEFINLRAQASESMMDYSAQRKPAPSKSDHHKGVGMVNNKHTTYLTTTDSTKSAHNCVLCKNVKHPLYLCANFRALPFHGKMSLLKTNGLCLNCLKSGHYANQCKSVNRCHTCQRLHHSLLHNTGPDSHTASDSTPTSNLITSHTATELNTSILIMTCKLLIEAPNGNTFEVRGILDSASSTSFVSERIVQTLRLPRSHCSTRITGITGLETPTNNHSTVNIKISPVHSPDQKMCISTLVVPQITCDLPLSPVTPTSRWRHLANLNLADPTFGTPGRIDVLLGVDIFVSVLLKGRRVGPSGTPVAINTKFGWVLGGSTTVPSRETSTVTCLSITENVDDLLRQFWEVENGYGSKHRANLHLPDSDLTLEEKQVLKHFKDSHTRTESGMFVVPLPRKEECMPLGESRSKAVRRFLSLERSLKTRQVQDEFHSVMEEYFKLEHAELVPEHDLNKSPENVFYLPMHAVHKESSHTTKLRIVFDASAKTSSDTSLNDTLMVGPTIHSPLIDVLLRFRLHRVAVVADISKMYRAVQLTDVDKDLHRFVWRRNPSEVLKDYRMTRLTFGVSASSFAANMAVRQNAIDHGDEYPLAAAAVSTSFYVDDGLMGADSIENAVQLVKETYKMFEKGGFLLRKWNSSNPSVLSVLPNDLKSTQVSHIVSDIDTQYTKTLGIEWNSVLDHFRLSVAELPPIINLTKRELVSDVAKTYDILGWFSPTTIAMKILLQRTWETGIGWDDIVPDGIRDRWFRWRTELSCLVTKHVPRCYFPKNCDIVNRQLHGFSDASEDAYSAVVYFRSVDSCGETHVSLITAKTKVAPIKKSTIPRLELCGAQLLAHLLHHLKELFNINYDALYAWTDSTIVLDWLSGHSRRFKTFVGNRIADIQDHIPPDRWNHVNGSSNPADCASRGLLPSELLKYNLWWDGPDWLSDDPKTWPKGKPSPSYEENEVKGICLLTSAKQADPIIVPVNCYSSFSKLKRVTAWIMRFVHNSRSTINNRLSHPSLSVNEIRSAENYWILVIQRQHFISDIDNLVQGKSIHHSSSLLSLCPILDKHGIIRIGNRHRNASKLYESVHPAILHGTHPITKLIIRGEHFRLLHGGPTLVHGSISRRFHIIGGYKVTRSVIRGCIICRKYSAKPQTQKMGDLPAERVRPDHPFSRVGIDYAGPFYTKRGHTRRPTIDKSYACVFVALSIKAVHVEVVSDLTSESFIATLRRFVARRGKPLLIMSDNGSYFVKANKDLAEFHNFLQSQVIQKAVSEFCSCQGIQWKFIPERAPHFGGLWESAVRSLKYHLKRIIGDVKLTFEELTTLLAQVEACLNSRPLTPLTSCEEGIEVLTPGHFLIGRPLEAIPDSTESHCPIARLRRWHLVQNLHRQFWERWSNEYLTAVRKTTKWFYPSRNIQVGDVVILKEDGLVPLKWPMARVIETHQGTDNRVRVVTIKTVNGIYKRPITKLILLLPVGFEDTD